MLSVAIKTKDCLCQEKTKNNDCGSSFCVMKTRMTKSVPSFHLWLIFTETLKSSRTCREETTGQKMSTFKEIPMFLICLLAYSTWTTLSAPTTQSRFPFCAHYFSSGQKKEEKKTYITMIHSDNSIDHNSFLFFTPPLCQRGSEESSGTNTQHLFLFGFRQYISHMNSDSCGASSDTAQFFAGADVKRR